MKGGAGAYSTGSAGWNPAWNCGRPADLDIVVTIRTVFCFDYDIFCRTNCPTVLSKLRASLTPSTNTITP